MNYVTVDRGIRSTHMTLSDVCQTGQTAFVGKCGVGSEHSLYLIARKEIVLASDPSRIWSSPGCNVTVDRYCDVNIIERKNVVYIPC